MNDWVYWRIFLDSTSSISVFSLNRQKNVTIISPVISPRVSDFIVSSIIRCKILVSNSNNSMVNICTTIFRSKDTSCVLFEFNRTCININRNRLLLNCSSKLRRRLCLNSSESICIDLR